MSSGIVRNLPEAPHRALKLRAAQHGRSTEPEIRLVLENAVAPKIGLGSALLAIGQKLGELSLNSHATIAPLNRRTLILAAVHRERKTLTARPCALHYFRAARI
jgi:plasmid stability protein